MVERRASGSKGLMAVLATDVATERTKNNAAIEQVFERSSQTIALFVSNGSASHFFSKLPLARFPRIFLRPCWSSMKEKGDSLRTGCYTEKGDSRLFPHETMFGLRDANGSDSPTPWFISFNGQ